MAVRRRLSESGSAAKKQSLRRAGPA